MKLPTRFCRHSENLTPSTKIWIALLAIGVITSSCMGDKTEDDYRKEKSQQELAKMMTANGTYRGTMTAESDGTTLGSVSLSLIADTYVQSSSDNLGKEQSTSIRGTIRYSGLVNTSISFSGGYYDSDSGRLKVDGITIQNSSGINTSMTLSGTISGNDFSGQLYIPGYESSGANLSLSKNATAPVTAVSASLQSGKAQQLGSEQQVFVGSYERNGQRRVFTLALSYPETRSDQKFLDIFSPERDLHAVVYLGRSQGQNPQYVFENAHIDDDAGMNRQGQLKAATLTTDNAGMRHSATLDCSAIRAGNTITSWNCAFIGDGTTVTQSVLSPAPAASANDGKGK